MKCYEILGVAETATIEQIQQAYEEKVAKYNSGLYVDDPQYAKEKLKILQEAYKNALELSVPIYCPTGEKPAVTFEENPEVYMEQLYHKHLNHNINRKAGIRPKRPKMFWKGDTAYKRSVIFFWIGIVAGILAIGSLL